MRETRVTFVVTYTDPDRMNQKDQTRHFPTKHQLDVYVHENLERIAPNAMNVEKFKLTTIKEGIQ